MDSELRAYLDEKLQETRHHFDVAIDQVRGEVQQVRGEVQQLRGEVQQLRGDLETTGAGLRGEVQQLRRDLETTGAGLRGEVQQMRRDFDTTTEQTRRHFDVVAEQMRGEVRLVAEGVSALSDRLDRVEQGLREEIILTRKDLGAMIKVSYTELDRRIQGLEGRYRGL